MLCNREGRWRASVIEIGVGDTGDNKLATAVIRYRLSEEQREGQWYDISAENLEITGYHYLEKKDSSINLNQLEQLKGAFGWDGRDPYWLQDHQRELPEVQITTEWDTYNGKSKIRVGWLNPSDYEGGAAIPKPSEQERRALSSRLGSKLRALAGGSPASPAIPSKPAASPAASGTAALPPAQARARSSRAATSPAPPAPTATMQEAWEVFCQQGQEQGADGETIQTAWFDQIEALREGAAPDNLTPEEWGRLKAQGYRAPLKL